MIRGPGAQETESSRVHLRPLGPLIGERTRETYCIGSGKTSTAAAIARAGLMIGCRWSCTYVGNVFAFPDGNSSVHSYIILLRAHSLSHFPRTSDYYYFFFSKPEIHCRSDNRIRILKFSNNHCKYAVKSSGVTIMASAFLDRRCTRAE